MALRSLPSVFIRGVLLLGFADIAQKVTKRTKAVLFQASEKLPSFFPSLGKIRVKFSKAPENRSSVG